jgi:hypothetical protein
MALKSYVKDNSDLTLELIQNDGMVVIYEQKLRDLFTKVKQLENKTKKQSKLLMELETKEVMTLVGK